MERTVDLLAPEEAAKVNARSGPDANKVKRTWEVWKRELWRRFKLCPVAHKRGALVVAPVPGVDGATH